MEEDTHGIWRVAALHDQVHPLGVVERGAEVRKFIETVFTSERTR